MCNVCKYISLTTKDTVSRTNSACTTAWFWIDYWRMILTIFNEYSCKRLTCQVRFLSAKYYRWIIQTNRWNLFSRLLVLWLEAHAKSEILQRDDNDDNKMIVLGKEQNYSDEHLRWTKINPYKKVITLLISSKYQIERRQIITAM